MNASGDVLASLSLQALTTGRECTRDPDWQLVRCTVSALQLAMEQSTSRSIESDSPSAADGRHDDQNNPETAALGNAVEQTARLPANQTSSLAGVVPSRKVQRHSQPSQGKSCFNGPASSGTTSNPATSGLQRQQISTLGTLTGADCMHLHAPPDLTEDEIELMGELAGELEESFVLTFECQKILVRLFATASILLALHTMHNAEAGKSKGAAGRINGGRRALPADASGG